MRSGEKMGALRGHGEVSKAGAGSCSADAHRHGEQGLGTGLGCCPLLLLARGLVWKVQWGARRGFDKVSGSGEDGIVLGHVVAKLRLGMCWTSLFWMAQGMASHWAMAGRFLGAWPSSET